MNLLEVRDAALPPGTLLGFRPEHFLPRDHFASGEPTQVFCFAVRRVEYLGSDRYVYGSIAEAVVGETTVIEKLPATVATPIRAVEALALAVPRQALRQFVAVT